jgi:dienelactone hydrolase
VKLSTPEPVDGLFTMPLELRPEEGLSLPAALRFRRGPAGKMAAFIVLHPDGYSHALDHPVAKSLVAKGAAIVAAECRATGANRPPNDAVHEAADHNSAEHSLWIGRPLLGQWVYDVRCLLDWLSAQPGYDPAALGVVGLGSMGVVALCAAAVDPRIKTVAAVESPVTLITESAYSPTIPMALLAPGLFHAGDVPQLAALVAPRPLLIADGVNPQGRRRTEKQMQEAYAFTSDVYRMLRVADRVSYQFESSSDDQATFLLRRP